MKQVETIKQTKNRPLPDDPALTIAPLLNTDSILSAVTERVVSSGVRLLGCEIKHIRYKPRRSCTVLYSLRYTGDCAETEHETFLFARSLSERRYEQAVAGVKELSLVDGILQPHWGDESSRVLYFSFPNDITLPYLPLIDRPEDLVGLIRSAGSGVPAARETDSRGVRVSSLRYKPGSRYVVRLDIPSDRQDCAGDSSLIVRFARGNQDAHFAVLKGLYDKLKADPVLGVPEPLAYSAEYGITVQRHIDGGKLSRLLMTSEGSGLVRRLARGLACFHALPILKAPVINPNDYQAQVMREAESLRYSGDDMSLRVDDIMKWVTANSDVTGNDHTGLVHGDFHQGQALCDKDRIWLVDFERTHIGSTMVDLGNFLAQHKLLQLRGKLPEDSDIGEQFVESYEQSSGREIDRASLNYWMVTGLIELANKEFRRLKTDYPERIDKILGACRDITKK